MSIQIHSSWEKLLGEEFRKKYFQKILHFLDEEREAWKTIYPHPQNIFAAFNATPVEDLKVVILGQDPYHGPGQAHGLSFSVQDGIKIPPSLRNISKEIIDEWFPTPLKKDTQGEISWNLTHWSRQWVLMLNSILTVEWWKPASHSKIWWGTFTDNVIKKISEEKDGIIFLLWGNFARWKKALIDSNKHFILESPHPSPFSAYSWFFGNGHFKKVNEILEKQWKKEIQW